MICITTVSRFCKDDISLIENYNEAVNSPEKYDCHHRLETDMNVSRLYLIDNDLYYNRPASELMFLTHSEHISLHHKDKSISEETKRKMSEAQKEKFVSEETKKKMSKSRKGKKYNRVAPAWNKGLKTPEESKNKLSESIKIWWTQKKAA